MVAYVSRFLEIDLSNHLVKHALIDSHTYTRYLGGIGMGAYLLNQLLPSGIDAFDAENILVFAAGTLTGTTFPTASRTEVSAKSPLTDGFGTSNSGMFFGTELKKAGYEGIIISGKSPQPVYIVINDDQVEILQADSLWGKDSWDCISYLEDKYTAAEYAVIGPAGENLVRFASLLNGRFDAWGRTGMGAVMGSKRLKAVVVKGTNRIIPKEGERFSRAAKQARQLIRESPFYKPFKKYGTMNASPVYSKFTALPGYNFTSGSVPGWDEEFSKKMVDKLVKKNIACHACPIACGHYIELTEGKYQGLKIKGLEITPTTTFGAQCGLSLEASLKACEICQRLGMDMVSAGSTVAMAVELFKKGLLSSQDIGYDLEWGDEDSQFNLLHDIAFGKGIGSLLSQGTARAANQISGGEKYAMQVKGLEIPMIDPRGRWSTWTLGMLTNVRGGDHLRCRNPVENLRFNRYSDDLMWENYGFGLEEYKLLDMPQELKEKTFDLGNNRVNIPLMAKWSEDLINLYNCLGICIRPPVLNRVGPEILAEAFSAFTGVEIDSRAIMKSSERVWNLINLFNLREIQDPAEVKFPERFYREEMADRKLNHGAVKEVLKKYYSARGWDPETGIPSPKKLEELGMLGV